MIKFEKRLWISQKVFGKWPINRQTFIIKFNRSELGWKSTNEIYKISRLIWINFPESTETKNTSSNIIKSRNYNTKQRKLSQSSGNLSGPEKTTRKTISKGGKGEEIIAVPEVPGI